MKKIILIFIGALVSLTITAESGKVAERVYIATDKDVYVAGDNVWCSAFCFDVSDGTPSLSAFSSTVYLELASDDGIAQTAKIALIDGRGAGVLSLRTNLPTGNYSLCAYTTQNRNEDGFVPDRKIISIFNVLSTERVKDNVVIEKKEGKGFEVMPSASSIPMELSVPSVAASSSAVSMSFRNPYTEAASFSVSIYKEDSLSALEHHCIVDCFSSEGFKSVGSVGSAFIPDYEGEVIHFRVNDIQDSLFRNTMNLFCAASGPGNNLFSSRVDSSGNAVIYTNNVIGERTMFCQVILSDTLVSCKISIEDPFAKYPVKDIPKLHVFPDFSEKLSSRGIGMQIGKRFGVDTIFRLLPTREDDFILFTKKYHLDHYTRFPFMDEVMIEFVPELMNSKRKGQDWIRVMLFDTFRGSVFSTGLPLLLLDGVPIFDPSKFMRYDPLLVRDLSISSYRYAVGNVMFEGVVRLDTYKGNLPSFDLDSRFSVFNFQGSLLPAALTGLVSDEAVKNYPDYRQTIYWNPIVDVTSGGTFDFEFKTPMYSGDFVVVIEGVTESGKPIYGKSSFKVK